MAEKEYLSPSEVRSDNVIDNKLNALGLIGLTQLFESKQQNENLTFEIKELKEQHHLKTTQMQEQLQQLIDENNRLKMEREAKERAKTQRKAKKRKPKLRSPIQTTDYDTVMSCVNNQNTLKAAKTRIALTILFLTGIRVGNLRTIYVSDLKQMYNKGDLIIQSIKSKTNKPLIYPNNKAFNYYLNLRKADFDLLFSSFKEEELIWDISREHLTRTINKILKQAGAILNKNLKSHSFRIGMATAVTEHYTIYEAQAILGHARIATTEKYVQSRLTKKDKSKIINKIFLAPPFATDGGASSGPAAGPLMDKRDSTGLDS